MLLVGSSVLVACSDDSTTSTETPGDNTTTSGDGDATTSTVGLAGDPVKVMVVFDQSPELVEGATAAAEAINRAGGLNGRPIEVVACDTNLDPNQAATCGRRAVEEGVVSLVGSLTPLSGSFLPLLAENHIASIGNVPVSPDDFSSPVSFPLDGGLVSLSTGVADAMAQAGATTVSVARADLALAAAIPQFANLALGRHDMEVVGDIPVPMAAPDMSSYVASATADGSDGVLVALFGQDAANFITTLRQQSADVTIGLVTTDLDTLIDSLGEAANGVLVSSGILPLTSDDPAIQKYLEDIEAAGFDDPGNYRINAYAATMAFAQIAAQLDEVTAEAVLDAASTATGVDIGLMPPLQFTEGGVGGLARVFNPCAVYLRVDDGELVALSDDGFIDVITGEPCPT